MCNHQPVAIDSAESPGAKADSSYVVGAETAMPSDETLRRARLRVEVNNDFTEAVIHLQDGSRLCFCHRVGERWAKAVGRETREQEGGKAGELLSAISTFRLNGKHLDIQFEDGSRSDIAFHDVKPLRR